MKSINRKRAKAFLREQFGNRIKFSRTMDAEIPPPENYPGGVNAHRFIVLFDNQMMEFQVSPNWEITKLPGYQESDRNRIDDWE
jgi:hypothetical protein